MIIPFCTLQWILLSIRGFTRKSRTEKYNRKIEELSKQLKKVSQNLDVELNDVMTTIPVTNKLSNSSFFTVVGFFVSSLKQT
jgi:flagellar motor switch protein FliM